MHARGNGDGLTKRQLLSPEARDHSRELRRNSTPAEKHLWRALRQAFPHAKFRRQVPLGSYFADFCAHSAKLIVEVDGGQHSEATEYDKARTRFLNSEGYRVLRFWNNEVHQNTDGVLRVISDTLSPSPSQA